MVDSLLTAIVRADGDALVMHVGEKPYVVAPSGPVELSSRPLTLEAVAGMLGQLLPADARRALDELGATEHDLDPSPVAGDERFTVVAARGGNDIWIEIRRHRDAFREGQGAAEPVVPAAAPESPTALEGLALVAEPVERPAAPPAAGPEPAPMPESASSRGPEPEPSPMPQPPAPAPFEAARQAVILPLARNPVRPEVSMPSSAEPQTAGPERLLRLAAARGATTLYLVSGLRPSIRVDGGVATLDGESPLTTADVESLLLDLAPEEAREALQQGCVAEWASDVPGAGRFRCQSFRDHRGPGGVFQLVASRPATVEQLGLSREVQSLCAEPDGLVLVAGSRSSGKSTLLSALVDCINRTRDDYVVTVEAQVAFAHESRGCLVSQREVRGGGDEVAAAVSAALRENPDVLVIEDMRSPAVVAVALDAMEAGRLVLAAVPAGTATAAVGRIVEQFPAERRERVQRMLADGLRGVVAQALVRKSGGGRIAAREVLLNTPVVAGLIAGGRTNQLPAAIDNGRKVGMVPLSDALAAFVQSGIVEAKDAYEQAPDRQAFLAALRRDGVDTSFVEKRA